MQKHVRMLGWMYIVLAVIDVLIGLFILSLLSGAGALSGDMHALGALTAIGGVLATIMFILAVPNLLVGVGFLRGWGGWVIVVACILSVLNLAKFPIGTVISIYTFWVAYRLYDAQPDVSATKA